MATKTIHLESEQIAWQIRANDLMGKLLDRQRDNPQLPLMVWSIPASGCVLAGQPAAYKKDSRAAVEEWAKVLGLTVETVPLPAGGWRVKAIGRCQTAKDGVRVQVVLTADLYDED